MKRTKGKRAARASVHVSIDVPELEAGLRFYGEVFGFVETARPFPTMAMLDGNNVSVCMHAKVTGSKSSSRGSELRRYERHWTPVHLDLHVDDFDAVLDNVRARGGAIENELRTQGPRPTAFCSDPFGNGFCVIGGRTASRSNVPRAHGAALVTTRARDATLHERDEHELLALVGASPGGARSADRASQSTARASASVEPCAIG